MGQLSLDKKLSYRQIIGLKILILMIKIVQPTEYSHEISKPLDDIEKLIKMES